MGPNPPWHEQGDPPSPRVGKGLRVLLTAAPFPQRLSLACVPPPCLSTEGCARDDRSDSSRFGLWTADKAPGPGELPAGAASIPPSWTVKLLWSSATGCALPPSIPPSHPSIPRTSSPAELRHLAVPKPSRGGSYSWASPGLPCPSGSVEGKEKQWVLHVFWHELKHLTCVCVSVSLFVLAFV